MYMTKKIKWIIAGAMLVALSGCTDITSDTVSANPVENSIPSENEHLDQSIAIDKIFNFIETKKNPPGVDDYRVIGFSEVDEENIERINAQLIELNSVLKSTVAQNKTADNSAADAAEKMSKEEAIDIVVKYIMTRKNPPSIETYNVLGLLDINEDNIDIFNNKLREFAEYLNRIRAGVIGEIPELTLNGQPVVILEFGDDYEEAGASAHDREDGNLSSDITIDGEVNTDTAGLYKVQYSVEDSDQNKVVKIRKVTVLDASDGGTNLRPTAVAGQDRTITIGESVLLDSRKSFDKDGKIVWQSWRKKGNRFVMSYETTHIYTPNEVGKITIYLNVKDDKGATGGDVVIITVEDKQSSSSSTSSTSSTSDSNSTSSTSDSNSSSSTSD
ncbi:MAG TPA: DUF5011 domain-containing protein, partial [Campylobacterales bacterium]|nr:DUF5011 domain-containing protein [Campylobacterales bacterium]